MIAYFLVVYLYFPDGHAIERRFDHTAHATIDDCRARGTVEREKIFVEHGKRGTTASFCYQKKGDSK